MSVVHRLWASLALSCCFYQTAAWGLPGAHVPAISTFDTRGSTVVVAYRESLTDVTFRAVSYNANFSSTSGNFSAQFGAHYVQIRDIPGVDLAHGAGAGGVGLFQIPVGDRFDNGVPRVSLPLYVGATPTVAVSGTRNFLTAPMVFGFGVSVAPAAFLTFTPFIEVSPSVNLDTFINSDGVEIQVQPQPDGTFRTTPIDEALANAVDTRFSVHVESRAGLMSTMHVGETWDFNLHGEYFTLGSLFGGPKVVQVGAGLGFHWDDVVPAVLPARRRLAQETCEDVERRFQVCPQYQELSRRPEPPQCPAPAATPAPASKVTPARRPGVAPEQAPPAAPPPVVTPPAPPPADTPPPSEQPPPGPPQGAFPLP
jgi:hypothetical protein